MRDESIHRVACCDDYKCKRTKPILVRQSELTGCWYVVTAYKDEGNGIICATTRHEITADFSEYLRQHGWVQTAGEPT